MEQVERKGGGARIKLREQDMVDKNVALPWRLHCINAVLRPTSCDFNAELEQVGVAVWLNHAPNPNPLHVPLPWITRIWGMEILVHHESAILNKLIIIRIEQWTYKERKMLNRAFIGEPVCNIVCSALDVPKGDGSGGY